MTGRVRVAPDSVGFGIGGELARSMERERNPFGLSGGIFVNICDVISAAGTVGINNPCRS